jgi:hypothetical protein
MRVSSSTPWHCGAHIYYIGGAYTHILYRGGTRGTQPQGRCVRTAGHGSCCGHSLLCFFLSLRVVTLLIVAALESQSSGSTTLRLKNNTLYDRHTTYSALAKVAKAKREECHSFETGCLPLTYSNNLRAKRRISQGCSPWGGGRSRAGGGACSPQRSPDHHHPPL